MSMRLAVLGATGRTGAAVVRLAAADPESELVAGLVSADDPALGRDVGAAVGIEPLGVELATSCAAKPEVLIDFSTAAATAEWAGWCAKHGVGLVTGTTGLTTEQKQALRQAAETVPVLAAPNMSLGVNLLVQLVSEVAARLGAGWDVEIVEAHHRGKVDAPSGTAEALLAAVCAARNLSASDAAVRGRSGAVGPRKDGEVGVHAVRMGGLVGEHDVHFATPGEVVTLSHRALSRDTFAAGALRAAKWLVGRQAGSYHFKDVLGTTG